jgi:S-phase kinase-associated protein 1
MAGTVVKLSSSDAQMFEVDEEVAFLSQTVKNLVEDAGTEDVVPLPNVSGRILAKVIEYCRFHVEADKKVDDKPSKSEDDQKQWDTEFVKVDQATLFDLILVSGFKRFSEPELVLESFSELSLALPTKKFISKVNAT